MDNHMLLPIIVSYILVDLYLSNSFIASFIIRDTYNIPKTITKQLLILKVVSEINI